YFGHTRFPLQKLRSLGFNICLGTDSLATTASLSLFEEMRELHRREPALAPNEIIEMVTVNPAEALRLKANLGRIKPGYLADLISIPAASGDDVCEQIIGCEKPISWIMIGGHALDSA
ncbi:MAG: amidohydrolase family protein, partial [Verrucomicrobiota bacterium]|nr:amidohydrolase family protein [Verrucomicrobiota bacterium]